MKNYNRVPEIRNTLGLTQNQLAKAVGITLTHMQNIEYGDSAPSIYLAQRIAQALREDVGTLFPLPER